MVGSPSSSAPSCAGRLSLSLIAMAGGVAALQGPQERGQIALLARAEADLEAPVEVLDDVLDPRRLAVVEVRRAGGQAAERRRPERADLRPLVRAVRAAEIADRARLARGLVLHGDQRE